MKRRLSVPNLSSENNLPMFQLNVPVVIRAKEKRCKQTLLFITMNCRGYISLGGKGQWGSLLHPGWSAPLRVSSGCADPPSPTAPVLCHGPALWSPPSRSDGDSPTYAPLQLTFPSSPFCRHLDVPSVLSPVFIWSPISLLSLPLHSKPSVAIVNNTEFCKLLRYTA